MKKKCLISEKFTYINVFVKCDGRLAQLEEHLVYTERVGSSNLSAPTNQNHPQGWFFYTNARGSNDQGELEERKQAECLFSDDRRRLLLS